MIYENVKEACEKRGKTIKALEEELGFPRGSIYKWNTNVPSVVKVSKVAGALGETIEFFMRDKEK